MKILKKKKKEKELKLSVKLNYDEIKNSVI